MRNEKKVRVVSLVLSGSRGGALSAKVTPTGFLLRKDSFPVRGCNGKWPFHSLRFSTLLPTLAYSVLFLPRWMDTILLQLNSRKSSASCNCSGSAYYISASLLFSLASFLISEEIALSSERILTTLKKTFITTINCNLVLFFFIRGDER